MKEIDNFWHLDHSIMTKEQLMETAREYYKEDFINNYSKWSNNLKLFNKLIYDHIVQHGFRSDLYEEMSYDWFCKNIIDMICEWIDVNGGIKSPDINIITERLASDYSAIQLKKHNDALFTIESIMASIKKMKVA